MFLNTPKNDCSICLGNMDNVCHPNEISELNNSNESCKTMSCNHTFHTNCIDEWLKNNTTCPNCRFTIKIIEKQISINELPSHNITINIPITLINNHNRNRNNNVNIMETFLKYFSVTLYVLLILFNLGSSIYYYYQSQLINNNINDYIKPLNMTELGNHDHNTYDSVVLIITDITYYFVFIITNIILFKNINDCCCSKLGSCIFLSILSIANLIIHFEFNRNTKSYLTDKNFNFDSSYERDLSFAMMLFGISFACELIFLPIVYLKYYHKINN